MDPVKSIETSKKFSEDSGSREKIIRNFLIKFSHTVVLPTDKLVHQAFVLIIFDLEEVYFQLNQYLRIEISKSVPNQ